MISNVKLTGRTTGTADTLIEIGRFLLEARAASRRAAGTGRTAAATAPLDYVQKPTTTSATGAPST